MRGVPLKLLFVYCYLCKIIPEQSTSFIEASNVGSH